jgi:hypothetical protein
MRPKKKELSQEYTSSQWRRPEVLETAGMKEIEVEGRLLQSVR